MDVTHRLAAETDLVPFTTLMERAIAELQRGYLEDTRIAASRVMMGSTQLITDRSYILVESDGVSPSCRCAKRLPRFDRAGPMATLTGVPLYRPCGYSTIELVKAAPVDGASVPLLLIGKRL